jgi:dTDP-4-amino-4,6-dideoxygalactose transaminase
MRRDAAAFYLDALARVDDLRLPSVPAGSDPVWHLFVVQTPQRDDLAEFLAARGVHTALHYPEPPHLSPAYASLRYRAGCFPVSELLAETALSLPIFPGITGGQLDYVAASVTAFFAGGGNA